MKKGALHFIFWSVYVLQDMLLQFTWLIPDLKEISLTEQFLRALITTVLYLPPKIAVVYYFIYRVVPKMAQEKTNIPRLIAEASLVFLTGVFWFRLIGIWIVGQYIYNNHFRQDFFEVRTILVTLLQMGYVTAVATAVKFARLRQAALQNDKLLVKEKLETELKFLRNQTNPHFLMNTLNNIYGLARKKSEDTPEAILKLSDLLKFILYKSTSPHISLGEEVKIIEHYLKLEQLRYTDRLNVCFTKKMDRGSYQISPLLLLPFIENAFKHGISETRFESFIKINLEVTDGQLKFEIENSKDAADSDRNNKIGLTNVKRQLELTYKDFQLDVKNGESSFAVYLSINLYRLVEF